MTGFLFHRPFWRECLAPALLFGTILTFHAAPVLADDVACATIGSLAASIMTERQEGQDQATVTADVGSGDAQAIIAQAFGQPVYANFKDEQRSISDFRETTEANCRRDLDEAN